MNKSNLKYPLILFSILILTAGAVAADFGGDDEGTSRDGFGSDTDDAGSFEDTDSEDSTTTTYSDTTENDSDSTRSGFGSDTDDEGTSLNADTDTETEEQTSTETDTEVDSDDFGSDTDDSGTSRNGTGADTDDDGSSREQMGNDTDDETSSRDGFGDESNETQVIDESEQGTDESDEQQTDQDDSSTDDSTSDSDSSSSSSSSGDSDDSETVVIQSSPEPGLLANLDPQTVNSGDLVSVEGTSQGITSDETVFVRMGSETVATAEPDSEGSFSTSFRPEETGSHQVTVSAGNLTRSFTIDVRSSVEISSVTWPDSVRRGDSFQICAEVESDSTPDVKLFRDGTEIDQKSERGTVCFNTEANREGNINYRVQASTSGSTDSKAATINSYTVSSSGTESTENASGNFMEDTSGSSLAAIGLVFAGLVAVAGAVYRFLL